jgi:pre-rRNA-processing protein TSR1
VAENEPDFMENEQTWPTEEELAEADGKCLWLSLTVTDYTDWLILSFYV